MIKTEISSLKTLKAGDRIELHYKVTGPDWVWYQAMIIAAIEAKAQANKNFWIKSSQFLNGELILTVDIVTPPTQEPNIQETGIITTAAVIAACTLVIGGVSWLLLDKVYQLTDSPAGQVAVAGAGLGLGALGIAAIGVVVLLIIKNAKGLKA